MKRFAFLWLSVFIVASWIGTVLAQNATPGASPKPLGEPDVKRSGKFYVQFYAQENFKGPVYRVPVPSELINDKELKKFGIPNDSIQSMKVPDGVVVTLYDAAGYGGKNQTYTGNVPTMGDMRSITSSLKAVLQPKQ